MIVRGVLAALTGTGSIAAQASFTDTVGLGSVVVGMLVVILFGIFSLIQKRNSGWKDLYEQEREKNSNLLDEKEAERVVRHDVKDELATTRAQLEIEKSKPDLSVILEQQRILWTDATADLTAVLQTMQETQQQMLVLLTAKTKGATS